MFRTVQRISFCYGHRLCGYDGKCRHLHGHNATAELTFESETLDAGGMVLDFALVKRKILAWLQENLDHRLLLMKGDPLIPVLEKAGELFVTLDTPPTAENLARLIHDRAKSEGFPVVRVRVWETPDQSALYTER